MKPEFKQLLKGLGIKFFEDGVLETQYLTETDFDELMINVWNLTIEVAAGSAEANLTILSEEGKFEIGQLLIEGEDYEVCVIKDSILKLKI